MDRTISQHTHTLPLQLKGGMFSLMTLELTTSSEALLLPQLEQLHKQMPDLFQNTPVVLTLNQLANEEIITDFNKIKTLCHQFDINVIAVKGGCQQQQIAALNAGLSIFPDTKKNSHQNNKDIRRTRAEIPLTPQSHTEKQSDTIEEKEEVVTPALIIDTPVRSGQQIYHSGDIIITAPVSTGAEVLAAGNIHIYSTLRGRALAGVNGNKEARIFCQQFEAELVSICGHFKPITSTSNGNWQQSVQIYLQDDHFTFKTL